MTGTAFPHGTARHKRGATLRDPAASQTRTAGRAPLNRIPGRPGEGGR
ncbi:DUF6380 family protein [Streptomyces sp. enrichment culture]